MRSAEFWRKLPPTRFIVPVTACVGSLGSKIRVLEVEPAGDVAGPRLAVAVDRDRLGVETARADGVPADPLDDERLARDLGRGRLRRAGRIEERHELLDVRRGIVLARQAGPSGCDEGKSRASRLSKPGRHRRGGHGVAACGFMGRMSFHPSSRGGRDRVDAPASNQLRAVGSLRDETLEIGLTSWLELMSPWNVTITFPEPIVPASGWASGTHLRSSVPAPWSELHRGGVGARAGVGVVRPAQMGRQGLRARAGRWACR